MVGVLEDVGAGLVDGHRAGARHWIGALPGMDRQRVEAELLRATFISHAGSLAPPPHGFGVAVRELFP
jgi:hypothetical protein